MHAIIRCTLIKEKSQHGNSEERERDKVNQNKEKGVLNGLFPRFWIIKILKYLEEVWIWQKGTIGIHILIGDFYYWKIYTPRGQLNNDMCQNYIVIKGWRGNYVRGWAWRHPRYLYVAGWKPLLRP